MKNNTLYFLSEIIIDNLETLFKYFKKKLKAWNIKFLKQLITFNSN